MNGSELQDSNTLTSTVASSQVVTNRVARLSWNGKHHIEEEMVKLFLEQWMGGVDGALCSKK